MSDFKKMERILSPRELVNEVKNNFDIFNSCELFDDSFGLSDLSEISFAYQFAGLLKYGNSSSLSNYSIDIKYHQITKNLFQPFLIVHLPKTQLANLLVIEFTKEGKTIVGQSKLSDMTKRNSENQYRLGILINFYNRHEPNDWKYFVDGQVMTKENAIRILEKKNDRAKPLLSGRFQKITDIYWSGKERVDEDKDQIALAQSPSDRLTQNYLWDTACNQLELDYEIMNLKLVQELYNFGKGIRKYLRRVWIPEYQQLSEMINFLHQNILPEIESSNYSHYFYNIRWLNQWEDVLPVISKLLLYCHYSIIENNPQKTRSILNELINISESFSDENILNRFENSFFGQ